MDGGYQMATKLDGRTWLRYSISVWDDIDKSPVHA